MIWEEDEHKPCSVQLIVARKAEQALDNAWEEPWPLGSPSFIGANPLGSPSLPS